MSLPISYPYYLDSNYDTAPKNWENYSKLKPNLNVICKGYSAYANWNIDRYLNCHYLS